MNEICRVYIYIYRYISIYIYICHLMSFSLWYIDIDMFYVHIWNNILDHISLNLIIRRYIKEMIIINEIERIIKKWEISSWILIVIDIIMYMYIWADTFIQYQHVTTYEEYRAAGDPALFQNEKFVSKSN